MCLDLNLVEHKAIAQYYPYSNSMAFLSFNFNTGSCSDCLRRSLEVALPSLASAEVFCLFVLELIYIVVVG